jgi:hypothetical protein
MQSISPGDKVPITSMPLSKCAPLRVIEEPLWIHSENLLSKLVRNLGSKKKIKAIFDIILEPNPLIRAPEDTFRRDSLAY